MRKWSVLLLIAWLVVLSLSIFTVSSASAQVGYKPSVPQFSVKLVDSSYDVPPSSSTTVDQYNGKETITTIPGYHVSQNSIEVIIKNQLFIPYTIESTDTWQYGPNGQQFNLYYTIQVKGHFGEDWKNFDNPWDNYYFHPTVQSNSEYTVVSKPANYAIGDQLDFRVKAAIGYIYNAAYNNAPIMPPQYMIWETAERSEWSSVQIFTVSGNPVASASPTQIITFPPVISDGNSQPQTLKGIYTTPFFLFSMGALFAGVIITVVLVFLRRQIKPQITQTQRLIPTLNNYHILVFPQFMLMLGVNGEF
ncbi:MAG: hypothetical protein FWB84_00580 [Candidatus Bathyarchaeota archaeon]|uniref:hypothetical protein n=1 Tax=Candidatus Bathycorpusculum sp. TaxID=2994959 RepID=UPI0028374C41|nr:hypothetical protein [Candidatus Termiticorpusculum sp.]MCL2256875.1 hypothetical protein [Candidatus Termiticorpusculum sp.]MCL2292979.1 hypothetical protein [Candidatus Termiticorpusculum sp.]